MSPDPARAGEVLDAIGCEISISLDPGRPVRRAGPCRTGDRIAGSTKLGEGLYEPQKIVVAVRIERLEAVAEPESSGAIVEPLDPKPEPSSATLLGACLELRQNVGAESVTPSVGFQQQQTEGPGLGGGPTADHVQEADEGPGCGHAEEKLVLVGVHPVRQNAVDALRLGGTRRVPVDLLEVVGTALDQTLQIDEIRLLDGM